MMALITSDCPFLTVFQVSPCFKYRLHRHDGADHLGLSSHYPFLTVFQICTGEDWNQVMFAAVVSAS